MTKAARCREVERLMIEGEDRALAPGERILVEEHLGECARCREFAADRKLIREELGGVRWPAPPGDLVSRTRRLVRESEPEKAKALPVWVLVVMAAVAIITAIGLTISLADVTPDMSLADLPVGGLAAVIIIVQNALMLFFAPVVLRAYRARQSASESAR
jgi:anti-sigma factor RsiW